VLRWTGHARVVATELVKASGEPTSPAECFLARYLYRRAAKCFLKKTPPSLITIIRYKAKTYNPLATPGSAANPLEAQLLPVPKYPAFPRLPIFRAGLWRSPYASRAIEADVR